MAARMNGPPSNLPTVKCSSCNMDIEISSMGEHICGRGPIMSMAASIGNAQSPMQPNFPGNRNPSLSQKGARMQPPRIDPNAANRPFLRPDQLTPASSGGSRGISPLTPSSRSPYRQRSPFFQEPPSPELTNLDCAFPPFFAQAGSKPSSARDSPRSGTPRSGTPNLERSRSDLDMSNPNNRPGRSMSRSPNPRQQSRPPQGREQSRPRRSPSMESRRTNGEPVSRPGTAASYYPRRKASLASISSSVRGGDAAPPIPTEPMPMLNTAAFPSVPSSLMAGPSPTSPSQGATTSPFSTPEIPIMPPNPPVNRMQTPPIAPMPLRPGPPPNLMPGTATPPQERAPSPSGPIDRNQPTRPPRPADELSSFGSSLESPPPLLQAGNRSKTSPPSETEPPKMPGLPRRTTEPVSQSPPRDRRPTLTGQTRPFMNNSSATPPMPMPGPPGATRMPGPSQGGPMMPPPRAASRNGSRPPLRADTAPPMPTSNNFMDDLDIGNPYHTPVSSTSSRGSIGSVAQSGSSRSTPPPESEFAQRSRSGSRAMPRRKASDTSGLDAIMDDLKPAFEKTSFGGSREPTVPILAPNFTAEPASTDLPSRPPLPSVPSMPRKPPGPPPMPRDPVPRSRTPSRRQTAKGNCRGCGNLIVGKSVSSADGRLAGRYHKECFNCKTCHQTFATGDFYILDNNPYCALHYHTLNGTLCRGCNKGIEGQYVQTHTTKAKLHLDCFACSTCKIALRHNYFELNGAIYCERDALRAMENSERKTSMLGTDGPAQGKGRFPERRTTMLMMA